MNKKYDKTLRHLLRLSNYKPLIAENKNRKRYKVFGFGYEQEVYAIEEGTSNIGVFEPDDHEWIAVSTYD